MSIAKSAKKCKVIAIMNHKGGVAKTTTAVSLAAGLARRGERVLAIDSDPQANFSSNVGEIEPESLEYTLTEVYEDIIKKKNLRLEKYIRHSDEGFDYIASNSNLEMLAISLAGVTHRETQLEKFVEVIRSNYTYILIDCCTSIGLLTQNAILASDSVVIPLQTQFLSVKGLESAIGVVNGLNYEFKKNVAIEGILLTLADKRTNDFKYISNVIHEMYGNEIRVYDAIIPTSVKVAEAAGVGMSIFKYRPKGKVAIAYDEFVREVGGYEE